MRVVTAGGVARVSDEPPCHESLLDDVPCVGLVVDLHEGEGVAENHQEDRDHLPAAAAEIWVGQLRDGLRIEG